ncbi:MAG TPA: ABC transporter permease [Lacunisphaera sp.]|jgi:predicted permease|nr:ABC transporter permease [Lacunisphaera sp.]
MFQDIRLAFRLLLKSPGFAFVAILTLGLGIGANTAIFSFINTFFFARLPFARPDELVAAYTADERNPGFLPISPLNFTDYRDHNDVFAGMGAYGFAPVTMMIGTEPTSVQGELVTGNFFDLLGIRPALGRTFRPDESVTVGSAPVVVLNHSFWTSRLASDPGVIGRTYSINGHGFTVIGVMPAGFRGLNTFNNPAFWVPSTMYPQIYTGTLLAFYTERRALIWNAFARLKPGVTIAQAEAALKPLGAKLAKDYPAANTGRSLRLVSLAESMLGPNFRNNVVQAGALLLSLSGLVLLIACANVANLLLARAAARQREVAVRIAVGADRARLIRQFLTESLLLSLCGGLTGIFIAVWTKSVLWSLRPPFVPDGITVTLDSRVLGFGLGVSLLTGLLFGLAPAWLTTKPELTTTLKEEGKGSAPMPLLSFRNFLVAGQIALSVIALVIAGLFIRSMRQAQRADPGWNMANLITFTVDTGAQGYNQAVALDYYRRFLERAATIPGVASASVANGQLLNFTGRRTLRPQGNDENLRQQGRLYNYLSVDPGYLRMLGIPLVAGRQFTDGDDDQHPLVAIVNETFAAQAWPGENPLGKTLKLYNDERPVEVVGIVKTTTYNAIGEDPDPFAFLPMKQAFSAFAVLHVRTRGDANGMINTLRKELQTLDPAMPLSNSSTMDTIMQANLWGPRTGASLLGAFGLLAVLLASLGVYGVMSYTVSRRVREIGIRLAIGAQPGDVLQLILNRGLVIATAGLGFGLVAAWFVARYFQNLLIGVSFADPLTYAAIAVILAGVAVIACWLPARRATKVDPLVALRAE